MFWDMQVTHHSCGFLFGVLHNHCHLVSDVLNEALRHPRLGVQDGAADVDAADIGASTRGYRIEHPERVFAASHPPGWKLQRVQIPAL